MKLATHNGSFHYDEVLATAILRKIYPDAELIRTRDQQLLDSADIVYDVGGVFDPSINRYDHHQKTFNTSFSFNHTVKLSSAGLIFKYFHELLFSLYNFSSFHPLYHDILNKIYNEFFLYADAIDNGYDISTEILPRTLSSVVSGFNVYVANPGEKICDVQNRQFETALQFVTIDLENYLNYIFNDYLPTYIQVESELLELDGPVYYTELNVSVDLIYDVDKKLNKEIQLVIFKNTGNFRIYSLRVEKNSFTSRCPLPEPWRGLRGADLDRVSGIDGCIFVHPSGFTGGNISYSGAIKMCNEALAATKL